VAQALSTFDKFVCYACVYLCVSGYVCVCIIVSSDQNTAKHWNILQHTATYCNTLQRMYCRWKQCRWNPLQHTETHYNILQHTTTHILQAAIMPPKPASPPLVRLPWLYEVLYVCMCAYIVCMCAYTCMYTRMYEYVCLCVYVCVCGCHG